MGGKHVRSHQLYRSATSPDSSRMSKSKLRSACAIDCSVSGCGRRKSLEPIEASALRARGDERGVSWLVFSLSRELPLHLDGAATKFDGPMVFAANIAS